MPQRRQKVSSKVRSRSPRQTVENPRLALKQEREQRKEALERERATSEILRVIAESHTDAQPVRAIAYRRQHPQKRDRTGECG